MSSNYIYLFLLPGACFLALFSPVIFFACPGDMRPFAAGLLLLDWVAVCELQPASAKMETSAITFKVVFMFFLKVRKIIIPAFVSFKIQDWRPPWMASGKSYQCWILECRMHCPTPFRPNAVIADSRFKPILTFLILVFGAAALF